jgi:hypothetical protein
MKTTVELPDMVMESARRYGIETGKTFKEVLIQAIELLVPPGQDSVKSPGWEKLFGQLKNEESLDEIRSVIDQEFSVIRHEDWA